MTADLFYSLYPCQRYTGTPRIVAMMYGMFGQSGYDLPFATDVSTLAGPALSASIAAYSE